MGQLFKNIVWLWLFSLLTATVGVSVHSVYCYCVGKTTQTLFLPDDACAKGNQSDKTDCCQSKKRTCCKKSADPQEKDGCTKKTTKVFQLKTEFTSDKIPGKKLEAAAMPALAVEPYFVKFLTFYAFCPSEKSGDLPPPVACSGREICVRLGCYRC